MSKGGFLYKMPIILTKDDKRKLFEEKKNELNELGLWETKEDNGEGEFTGKTFSPITIFNRSIMCTIKSVIETEIKKIDSTKSSAKQDYLDKLYDLKLIGKLDAKTISDTDFDINCLNITNDFLNSFFGNQPTKIQKDVCLLTILFNYNVLEQVCNAYSVTVEEEGREIIKQQLKVVVVNYFELNIKKYNQHFDYGEWVNTYIPKSLQAISENRGLTFRKEKTKKISVYNSEETKKINKDCSELESIITYYETNQKKKEKLKEEFKKIVDIGDDNEQIKAYSPSGDIKTSVDADIRLLSLKSSKKYFELFNYLVPLNLESYSGLSKLLNKLFGNIIKHLYYKIDNKYYEINIQIDNVPTTGTDTDAVHFLLTNDLKIQQIENPIDGTVIVPIVNNDDIYPNYDVSNIENSWATYALILKKRNKLIDYLGYIQNYDENLSNGFFSFIGEMGEGDFRIHSLNSVFYPFLYSGKISVLIELLKDDYSQYINIGDDLHIENLKKLMSTAIKSFGTEQYKPTVKSIETIYKNHNINFEKIKLKIIDKLIEKDDTMIISYMNFNLQKDIIMEFNKDLKEEQFSDFTIFINKLNNIIKYDIDEIRNFFAFRLTYIVINFVLLAKEINVKLLLTAAYLLIIDYINAHYTDISKIVNIKQLNDDLFRNNIFVGGESGINIQTSLFNVISDNYPSFLIRATAFNSFDYAKDNDNGKRDGPSAPCVEIAFLNLLKYMVNIDGTENFDWNLLPPNTSVTLKNFLSTYNTETKIQYLASTGVNNALIQNYYRAVHNSLSDDEFKSLKEKIIQFEPNLDGTKQIRNYVRTYWRTENIRDQNEIPGRYSFFCIVISKLFGLDGIYKTSELIKNFDKFIDLEYGGKNPNCIKDMNIYPNDTFKHFLKQFRSYNTKLNDNETYVYAVDHSNPSTGLITGITMNVVDKIKFDLKDVHGNTIYLQSATAIDYNKIYDNLYDKYNEFNLKKIVFLSNSHYNISQDNIDLFIFNPNDYFLKFFIYKNNSIFIYSGGKIYGLNPLTNPKIFKLINKNNIMYLHNNTPDLYTTSLINNHLSTHFNFYNYSFPEYTTYMLNKYFDNLKNTEFIIPSYFYNIIYYKYFNTNNIQNILTIKYFYELLDLPPEVLSYSYYISDKTNTSDKLLINFKNIVFILFTTFVFSTDEKSTSKFSNIDSKHMSTYYFEFMFFVFLKSDEMIDQSKDIRYALLERLYEINYLLLIDYMLKSLPISLYNYKLLYAFIKNKLDGAKDDETEKQKARNLYFALLMYVPQKLESVGLTNLLNETELRDMFRFIDLIDLNYPTKINNQIIFNSDLLEKETIDYIIQNSKNKYPINNNFGNIPHYDQKVFIFEYKKMGSSESEDYGKLQKVLLLYKAIRKNIISYDENYKTIFKQKNPHMTTNALPIAKFYPYSIDMYYAIYASNIIRSMYNNSVDSDVFQSIFKYSKINSKIHNEISPNRKFNVKDVNSTVKWQLMNTLTNEINKVLFKDVNKDNIFNFHMMTTRFINYELDQDHNITNFRDIFRFVYKGGSSMLFLKQIFNEQIREPNRQFFNKFNNDFSRSDIDFIIVIDKKKHIPTEGRAITEDEYKNLYININKAVSTALIKVKYFLSINNEIYYNFNSVTKKDLQNCICELRNTLNIHKKDSVYENITELVGISFWNKIYTAVKLPESITGCEINNNSIIFNSSVPKRINEVLSFDVTKIDYYVGKTNESGKTMLYSRIIDPNNFDPDSEIKNNIINSVYYYANETHLYNTTSQDVASFALHRIKLNSKIIFKASETIETITTGATPSTNYSYGEFNCPIEIVDVSIKKYNDTFDIDIDHEIDEYTYKHPIYGDYKFYSYSVYGFLNDLIINMFIHNKYPWNDNKYNKRMSRLIYFALINLITKNPDSYPLVITKIIAFLNKLKTDIQNKKESDTEINVDKELIELQRNLNPDTMLIHTLCDKLKSLAAIDEVYGEESFDKYLDLLNTTLTLFNEFNESIKGNPVVLENTKESNFFNKYLKYKQKYLQLKSQSKKY